MVPGFLASFAAGNGGKVAPNQDIAGYDLASRKPSSVSPNFLLPDLRSD
jgi:hypothetical protein